MQKKVIAQQVQSVYPMAINSTQGIIPDVFETASKVEVKNGKTFIETKKQHGFADGDEVKLILDHAGEKIVRVTIMNENVFSVDELISDKIFVYGKKVNDLLTVDYDALTTLNISATQELVKLNKSLQDKLDALNMKYEELISETNKKLIAIEAKLIDIVPVNHYTTFAK